MVTATATDMVTGMGIMKMIEYRFIKEFLKEEEFEGEDKICSCRMWTYWKEARRNDI